MNRRKRRKAMKLGQVITTSLGRGKLGGEPKYVECYACGGEAKEWPWQTGAAYGFVMIEGIEAEGIIRMLCEACHGRPDISDIIFRKITGASDCAIQQGGEATPEQVQEIAETIAEQDGRTKH